jgi:hypothetical protein
MVPVSSPPLEHAAAPHPTKEQQILAARGIRVLSVTLGNLLLPERVQEGRMQRWRDALGTPSASRPDTLPRSGDPTTSDPDAAWSELTGSLRTDLAKGASPDLQSTLRHILSDAVRLADQIGGPVARQQAADEIRAIASAVGASPAPPLGSSGDRGDA